jgi:hypothetical protein
MCVSMLFNARIAAHVILYSFAFSIDIAFAMVSRTLRFVSDNQTKRKGRVLPTSRCSRYEPVPLRVLPAPTR